MMLCFEIAKERIGSSDLDKKDNCGLLGLKNIIFYYNGFYLEFFKE